MTAKEALKTLLNWFDDEHIGLDKCVKETEEYKIIEKDLEILEIIKEKAKGNRFFKGCLLRMFQEDGEKKTYLDNPPRKIDENYYKIKEWLKND